MRFAKLLAAAGLLAAGILWFARDPRRVPPAGSGQIVSPADGRVLAVEPVRSAAPRGERGPEGAWRIVIFLSLWDVHVQRAPDAGRVMLSERQTGGHAPAMQPGAARNAGHWLGLETAAGPLLILRTAGLLVRRVTTAVTLGQTVARGQRIGRILLGSRTEIFLPLSLEPATTCARARQSLHIWSAGHDPAPRLRPPVQPGRALARLRQHCHPGRPGPRPHHLGRAP
jgi:phosphatidylserine decarboxylase